MKKIIATLMVLALSAVAVLAGAESFSGTIDVISREDGSGTRGAFIELMGIEQKDADGNKVDYTTDEAIIANSTSIVTTSVAGDEMAIGYISLGSLDETVKALSVDGVEPTVENIKAGTYKVARPFNVVTKSGAELSEIGSDFMTFVMSADGQAVINENGYIGVNDAAEAYTASGLSGKLTVGGSSSVTPVMEKLAEAYMALNPDASIEVQMSDSTTGVTGAVEGTYEIGMASRELKDTEVEAGAASTVIAMDGIAIVVNLDNPIADIASDKVTKIYTGEITDWADVTAE
jgi:phosphate transport system substrate-binding protein